MTRIPVELRGTAFGVFNLASGLALFAASVLAGALWDRLGQPPPFLREPALARWRCWALPSCPRGFCRAAINSRPFAAAFGVLTGPRGAGMAQGFLQDLSMHAAMIRRARIVLIAIFLAPLAAPFASAQFGTIFGSPPPRPPSDVGPPADERLPPRQLPPQGPPGGRPPAVRSEPLPPPPGAPLVPLDTRPQQSGQPPSLGLPPGQRPPRGTPQPVNTAPQPGDEVIAEPPTQKIPNQAAVFSGLDKITGRIISFDVAINETVQFGALQVTPRVCYTRPPTETPNTDGFVEVDEVTLQGEVRRIFTGWMFASSPGLHAVEHPIYDVWLTDCKAPQIKVADETGARTASAAAAGASRRNAKVAGGGAAASRPAAATGPAAPAGAAAGHAGQSALTSSRISAPDSGRSSGKAAKSPSPIRAFSSSL